MLRPVTKAKVKKIPCSISAFRRLNHFYRCRISEPERYPNSLLQLILQKGGSKA